MLSATETRSHAGDGRSVVLPDSAAGTPVEAALLPYLQVLSSAFTVICKP